MAKRTGIMLATPLEGQHVKWQRPFTVQPKLDGVRCRALISSEGVALIGSGGLPYVSVPHITRQLSGVWTGEGETIELDGELYVHGMPFCDVSGITRRHEARPEHEIIEYHVFDVVNDEKQWRRTERLAGIMENLRSDVLCPSIIPVQAIQGVEPGELNGWLDHFLQAGYEGAILRNPDALYQRKRTNDLLKVKPRQKDHYPVIGWTEEQSIDGQPKGAVGSLVCKKGEHTFGVGTGMTRKVREHLWSIRSLLDAGGFIAEVAYLNFTAARDIPYQPVLLRVMSADGKYI